MALLANIFSRNNTTQDQATHVLKGGDFASHEIDAELARVPARRHAHLEWPRTMLELLVTQLASPLLDHWPHGDGHPVLVIPGFLADARSTRVLRKVLKRLGYEPYDWGEGRNLGVRDGLTDSMSTLLSRIAERHGRKVSLIGWSLGGIFARELARAHPDQVRSVITLGSPFRGNHLASRAWWLYSLLNRGAHADVEPEARRARAEPLPLPTTCIYSKSDGVVAWQCCTSVPAPTTENVEVRSSHLGFGHNLETLWIIADRLAQPEGQWTPYTRPRERRKQRKTAHSA